ncbi:MAG: poly-gamma-glutamate hydrolase family protein [Cyanobacteria bacterium REEB67]|nr:poly-gamma-glutamate hydrolase family protein [Cyanobacteria bacterium REEB67]
MKTDTDFYQSLEQLQADLQRDVHYRVRIFDRRQAVTLIAPHGGFIEAGTSHIAEAIAGSECNFFDFQALHKRHAKKLHVTSVRFRHGYLVGLLGRSNTAVSIHSKGSEQNGTILLGGLNSVLKERIFAELKSAGFPVTTKGPRHRGVHPRNIVNLAQEKGVQIELTSKVIARMFVSGTPRFSREHSPLQTTAYFDSFVEAVRRATR